MDLRHSLACACRLASPEKAGLAIEIPREGESRLRRGGRINTLVPPTPKWPIIGADGVTDHRPARAFHWLGTNVLR